jgi:uncharacterized protein YciW
MRDMTDLLDTLLGPKVAALRAVRPDFVRFTQGSHDTIVAPAEPPGLTASERALAARRTAELSGHVALTAHYAAMPAAPGPRDAAILRHVEMLATQPGRATRGDLDALRDAGLSTTEVVTLSQLVAFVAYQTRVAAGLALLGVEARP